MALLKQAREQELYFPKALELAEVSSEISAPGKDAVTLLAKHLDGISYGTSAWTTLSEYLFARSAYARNLCAAQGVSGAQRRIAVYQLLQFAHRMRGHLKHHGEDPKRAFLDYIRRLELYGQERQLRQPPTWASDVDAVRMLTVHASKGLEFSVVYLPQLGKGRTPLRQQPSSCSVPEKLVPEKARDWHLEEEECLFFVALSRTRDTLWLSRAVRYGKQNSNPSDFLGHIQSCLPRQVDVEPTLPTVADAAEAFREGLIPSESLTATNRDLETYMRCPKQYLFDRVLELGGRRTNTAYVRFHACVYRTLSWIGAEEAKGAEVKHESALEILDVAWKEGGPIGHVYEKFYRREAERFLKDAVGRMTKSPGKALDLEWQIQLCEARPFDANPGAQDRTTHCAAMAHWKAA